MTLPYSGSISSGQTAFAVANTGGGAAGRFEGRVEVTTDLRTPITYDYNDMSYYVDPSGSSRPNGLSLNGLQLPTGAASGRVLTSDAWGDASWQTPSSGGIGGSGTYGRVALWNGTASLTDSLIEQSGSTVTVGRGQAWSNVLPIRGNTQPHRPLLR